jgi:class 3 adenylate cyclase/tetratricopeptide (TPR) repeat protein
MSGGHTDTEPTASALVPYLPRLVIDWLATEPEAAYREVEGSVAFVDVSGFTRLSERLARSGKVGAEELAETISTCFTALLAIAYAEGGGLLKFGGDALLLLFVGPGHELRACRAAVAMRRALGEVGRLDVLGRRVVLRMSVGIHSGRFNFFLVGASHRELIITGPAASTTVRMEGTAEAGEVLVSEQTAAALSKSALGAGKGPGVLLRRLTYEPSIDLTEPVHVPAMLDLSVAVPVALRRSLLDGTQQPEHRRATVAFVHFDGTDELIQQRGTAETATSVASLVEHVQQAVDHNGVTFLASDVDHDGGKIILVAGAPVASGDDEQRMLLALLDVVSANTGLSVRIGVNRGDVFVGDIGPAYRRTYTVMGDTVNLAARLMAKATPGEVVATQGVLARSRARFEAVALEPFMVKGKAKPVHAFRVERLAGASVAVDAAFPLVGRDDELAILLGALQEASNGRGSVLEVVGEPGLGKSRLVEELRSRAGEALQLASACETYESSTPYYPFRRVMRGLLGLAPERGDGDAHRVLEATERAAPALVPWAPLVGAVVDVTMAETPETATLDERFRPRRLAEVVLALLRHLLPALTVWVFEDVHWMDEASSALLHELGSSVGSAPWLVCTTRRDIATGHVVDPEVCRSIRLAPLSADAATRLAYEASASLPVTPQQLASLAERAAGNPLFLRELVAAAGASTGLDAVPDSVESLITARIDGLAAGDRNLLRRLAVLGRRFPTGLLGAVLDDVPGPEDILWDRVRGFVRAEDEGLLAFDHALVRDAAYEGLPYRLRRVLHARAGDAITKAAGDHPEDQAEILSLHYIHAHRYSDAWSYALIAAERSRTVYANMEAAEFYERAVEASRHLADLKPAALVELHERLGEVRERAGAYAAADTAYRGARGFVRHDAVRDAGLMLRVANLQGRLDRYSRALAWITRGLRRLEGSDSAAASSQRAELLAMYAQFCMEEGQPARALSWCHRAIEAAEAAGSTAAEAYARRVLDWALFEGGRLATPTNMLRSLALYEELGNLGEQARVLGNLGVFTYWKGDWDQAVGFWQRAGELLGRLGDTVRRAFTDLNIAEVRLDQGKVGEAEPLIEAAYRVVRASGDRGFLMRAKLELGRAEYLLGRHERATQLLEEAGAEARAIGAQIVALEADVRLAECRLVSGDAAGALALVEATLASAAALPGGGAMHSMFQRVRGVAAHRLGDIGTAAAALQDSVEAARARDAPFDVALGLRALADIGDVDGVPPREVLLAESRQLLTRLGCSAET